MVRSLSACGAVLALILSIQFPSATADDTKPSASSRDVFPDDVAGNEDVQKIIRSFEGKGEVGDDSQPTPAEKAVTLFTPAAGLQVELVASEPAVEQPLFMHFDDRGRMWVVQYRQYPFPAGLKVIRYDQYLRAVFDKVPAPPPNHVEGKDKITVFEDTDGDGVYDTHKDVITGLNIATAVVTGRGGIWVLNPPYLLFYPDADRDDVPDGDPEVHLSGFGLEDTHSVANSLMWGPDGWLYGANGSTTTGNVSSAATKNVRWLGQCIWRYHPVTKVFEIFAEGGGNTFSLEIDGKGRVFSGTNNGNTRGMFYPQHSYAVKNWGKHGPLTNPYAFGFFEHMRHEGDKDRFAQTFVIYEGGALPQRYHGHVIAANALHNRVWGSELIADTSTYRTLDMPPVVETSDRWFRPVGLTVGPDGGVYIADWYDTRLTHVDPRDNWHKTSGRIYRVVGEESGAKSKQQSAESSEATKPSGRIPWVSTDLTALSDDQLIELFAHPNKWWRHTAVRVLGERLESAPDEQAIAATLNTLLDICYSQEHGRALEALWTLHLAGRFNRMHAETLLAHNDEHVRRWAIRLLGDHRRLDDHLARQLAELAQVEPYVQVRSQLASSSQRFETRHALPIITALLTHEEDQSDLHMPLLLWWAVEAHAGDPQPIVELFRDGDLWTQSLVQEVILSRLMQRFALAGLLEAQELSRTGVKGPQASANLDACAQLLELAPTAELRARLMTGFLEAYEGREISGLPATLQSALEEYQQSLGQSDLALGLRLGNDEAINQALEVINDESADIPLRLTYLDILGQLKEQRLVAKVLGLLGSSRSPAIKRAVMEALMNFDDLRIGQTICQRYHTTLPAEHGLRTTAHRVLATRPEWTRMFLDEIASFRIDRQTIPLDIVQQMRLHDDPQIQSTLDQLWGRTRLTPAEKHEQIERLRALVVGLRDSSFGAREIDSTDLRRPNAEDRTPDPHHGRELFKKHCGVCHTLFDEGGQTGPNLTGYERTNLDFLLLAIVDPSAAIREEFTQFKVLTKDGRVLTGLIDAQTPTTLTLRLADNQTTLLNRDDIEVLQAMETSLMPDGLTEKLTDGELRSLLAYVMSRTPPR